MWVNVGMIQITDAVVAIAQIKGIYCRAIGGRFVANGASVLLADCRESIGELIKLRASIAEATGLNEIGFFSKGDCIEMLGAI